ncbi:hypothetical protein [Bathymodiolus platifrons methanotrophic gill symbiont]|uniref:hypothetical protein n=1 Tax=Bathymodiolus platifrons methanotrophic gill symbiont TaxID=113268 RepID=UPI001C8DD342|nr:hypothetical protein [Bathymodiolus platifrons methanotrophic gill symbiont]
MFTRSLSIIVPFTSSMTSNLWRCLDTLFGFEIKNKAILHFHGFSNATVGWAMANYLGANPAP